MSNRPYDPLDYDNLTANLVRELMSRESVPLPLETPFKGPGVYALFYEGNSELYSRLRASGAERPIYVGQAVPSGSRKGGIAYGANERPLYNRLKEHWESIMAATNLHLSDFRCRYLVVVPLWISVSERFLIERYHPAWNVCIEGFGNHDPGKGRHQGEISWWDALHPGRPWAARLRQTRTHQAAIEKLSRFFATHGA